MCFWGQACSFYNAGGLGKRDRWQISVLMEFWNTVLGFLFSIGFMKGFSQYDIQKQNSVSGIQHRLS